MNSNNLGLLSLRNAAGTAAYVFAIAWFLSNVVQKLPEPDDTFLAPVFMLLLFVVSAAITGFLVVGKPAMLYMNGLKTEAVKLFLYTILWLVIIAAIVILSIAIR